MERKDIIITAFSCGGKMKCKKEAETFKEPPIVLSVPGGSEEGFIQTARDFRAKNSILDSFLKSKLKNNIQPRRICLVSFDIGWAWTTQILRSKRDIGRIDTIIVIDGIHTTSLKAWIDFARKTAKGGDQSPKLWLAHTQGKLKRSVSAKTTNAKIFRQARPKSSGMTVATVPDYIFCVSKFQKPITVYSKDETPKRKIYHSDPLDCYEQHGNLVRCEYEGNTKQDHIYAAQYVQPRFWRWLRDMWYNINTGVVFD